MYLSENLLQYIWQFKKLPLLSLRTTGGEQINVIDSGILNTNSGPDFLNARLKIGATDWIGTVEVHYNASDWDLHGHQFDKSYNNVILHVVYDNNKIVKRENGTSLPTLELKPLLVDLDVERFNVFFSQVHPIPCSTQMKQIDNYFISSQILSCALERMQLKSDIFFNSLKRNNGNWEETAYQMLFKSFGMHLNGLPFEMLARSIPFKILKRLKFQPMCVQALLFGQAGLLQKIQAPSSLIERYNFLQKKYRLRSISTESWKFMRTRPRNFPTLRLAQLSTFIMGRESLFDFLMQERDLKDWEREFMIQHNSPTWNRMFTTEMGKSTIYSILINTVAVLQYSYGRFLNDSTIKERAISLMEKIPTEDNKLVRLFELEKGLLHTSLQSQGILHLFQQYCSKKRCLGCKVGFKLLS